MKPLRLFLALAFTCQHAFTAINQFDFDTTLDTFREIYASKLQSDLGLSLRLESFWHSHSIITKSQARRVGSEAIIFIDGDLAKEAPINKAAFVILVCHEFGHIYGDTKGELKLTKEGKADYWASGCALDYFSSTQEVPTHVPSFLETRCKQSKADACNACMLVASGISAYATLHHIRLENLVDEALNDRVRNGSLHPTPLCRVKTFISGLFGDETPVCMLAISDG